jgi:hypothetical protein
VRDQHELLERLFVTDRRLKSAHGELRSLSPDKRVATPLSVLGERALSSNVAPEVASAFADALVRIAEAQSRHFPDNLFWDLDYPAARLLSVATPTGVDPQAGAARIAQAAGLVEKLEEAYGVRSAIRFRYVHDFVYGFDWARWVAREPNARHAVGPFDAPFLEYLLRRAGEIEGLIQRGDDRYGPLREGENRNPFRFIRGPAEEALLHEDLAARGLIPVAAWQHDARPEWTCPYEQRREERAVELGLVGGS